MSYRFRSGVRRGAIGLMVAALVSAATALTGLSAAASPATAHSPEPDVTGAPLAAARNLVGSSVAISGDVAVIGAPGVHYDTGVAYVYVRSGGSWRKRATLTDPREADGDYFANAVGITVVKSVTYLVIGDGTGNLVYSYTGAGGTWHLRQTLRDPGKSSADAFGGALAVSGSTLVVGSPSVGYDFGAAYIYSLAGARWALQASLADPTDKPLDLFGRSMAITGSIVLIGAVDRVYAYSAASGHRWTRSATIPNPGTAKDNFGAAIAAVGATAVIGAPGDNPGPFYLSPGAAYVYTVARGTWTRRQQLPLPGKGDFFGYSAAMSGDRMVVGMPWYGADACGAVFEYERSGGSWRQRERLEPPGCSGGDQFGDTVALAGTTLVIGTPNENVEAGNFSIRTVP
jgi:FG-GAP repeat